MIVRTHLLCPYQNCEVYNRTDSLRIQALIDEKRNVILQKPMDITSSKIEFQNKKWIRPSSCPYCNKHVDVVINETNQGRDVYLRKR